LNTCLKQVLGYLPIAFATPATAVAIVLCFGQNCRWQQPSNI